MSNAGTHLVAAAATGMSFVALEHATDAKSKSNPALAIALASLGGKLPDILEPAVHPHHRKFFHSIAVLASIGWGVKKAYQWDVGTPLEKLARLAIIFGGVGYLSHLVLDASTPMGIPIIR